jgi:hypothetical protein
MDDMDEHIKRNPIKFPEPDATDRASFAAYRARQQRIQGFNPPEAEFRRQFASAPDGSVGESRIPPRIVAAIIAGARKKVADIRSPALAIITDPQDLGPWVNNNRDPAVRAVIGRYADFKEKLAKTFESGVPGSRVVRLNANHYVFLSKRGRRAVRNECFYCEPQIRRKCCAPLHNKNNQNNQSGHAQVSVR